MKYLKLFEEYNEGMEVDVFGNLSIPDCIIEDPDDDMDIAYDKGKESFHRGYDLSDNPYEDDVLKTSWDDGFSGR
jgi:hypothetical protein